MTILLRVLLVAVAVTAGGCSDAAEKVERESRDATQLTELTLDRFRARFNRDVDSPRLLLLLSPT